MLCFAIILQLLPLIIGWELFRVCRGQRRISEAWGSLKDLSLPSKYSWERYRLPHLSPSLQSFWGEMILVVPFPCSLKIILKKYIRQKSWICCLSGMCNVWCSSDLFDGFYNVTGFFFFFFAVPPHPALSHTVFYNITPDFLKEKKGDLCLMKSVSKKKKKRTK